MKISDLKGKIFFEKDREGNLSQLLYAPFLKIFNPKDDEDFLWGLSSLLFLMTWDNILITKKLRVTFFQLLAGLIIYGNEKWSTIGVSFIQIILLTFSLQNSFGVKSFIDLENKKILHWEEILEEAGIQIGFF